MHCIHERLLYRDALVPTSMPLPEHVVPLNPLFEDALLAKLAEYRRREQATMVSVVRAQTGGILAIQAKIEILDRLLRDREINPEQLEEELQFYFTRSAIQNAMHVILSYNKDGGSENFGGTGLRGVHRRDTASTE